MLSLIQKYFPQLSEQQYAQFEMLPALYREWNDRINVISRKDLENLMLHHVLHSLSIAKFISFNANADVMDIGTGGGFPGIPLAIIFPSTNFTLVDSVGKKVKVVNEISKTIELKNIAAVNERAEKIETKFDFIVSRATASLSDLNSWSNGKMKPKNEHVINNGIICLKGGNLEAELSSFTHRVSLKPVNQYFNEEFFNSKYLVYLSLNN